MKVVQSNVTQKHPGSIGIPRSESALKKNAMTQEDQKLVEILQQLPLDYWDFKDDDTKEYTHGIHNYPAMMVCPISRNITRIMKEIRPVSSLFDPFAGSGTVLVEGMIAGIETIAGSDINPLALMLSKAKTTRLDTARLRIAADHLIREIENTRTQFEPMLKSVDGYIIDVLGLDVTAKKGWGDSAPKYLRQFCEENGAAIEIPDFKNIGYWFKPYVILELSIIKSAIKEIQDPTIRDYIFIAFSEVIRFVSNRRNGEFKMFRMTPDKVAKFNPAVFEEFKRVLYRNIEKMEDFVAALDRCKSDSEVHIYNNNACTLQDVPDDTFDLVITSPPYGDSRTTVAYGEYSRLSLQWIDLFNLTEKEIMGVDKSLMGGKKYRNGFDFTIHSPTLRTSLEKITAVDVERAGDVYSFYEDLDAVIKSVAAKTKQGGYQFWVVGNRTVKNELLLTDVIISEIAAGYGLATIYTVNRNIPNKVMPARNSPSNIAGNTNATMTMEHIVVLRKI